ncbi:hypothetical protein MJN69_27815, partial [Salmonella enterica subsp. enterica serovar Kentucky]|nr:hypothetical protein [Salmonella enterica subsp. enterica serovar Kentucky]
VENARIIIGELEKYSQDLAAKPRWLVFNKIDLMDKTEAEEKAVSPLPGYALYRYSPAQPIFRELIPLRYGMMRNRHCIHRLSARV